jgi:hypothetical protein
VARCSLRGNPAECKGRLILRRSLYAAKSTEDKRGSIPGQLKDAREFAREQGLEVVAEYSEEDVSAYRGNRGPELAAALEHAERIAEC